MIQEKEYFAFISYMHRPSADKSKRTNNKEVKTMMEEEQVSLMWQLVIMIIISQLAVTLIIIKCLLGVGNS